MNALQIVLFSAFLLLFFLHNLFIIELTRTFPRTRDARLERWRILSIAVSIAMGIVLIAMILNLRTW